MSDAATEFKPNLEKLRKLQAQASSVVIGGKGVPRRKKKIIHKTATTDDKKLQSSLKKLTVNPIQGIDEVNMFKETGEVLHFVNPKVQASLASNIFAITGHAETKQLTEMLPTIMQQLGAENVMNIKNLAKSLATNVEDYKTLDDDVPQLVENFDEASKNETTTVPVATPVIPEPSPVKNTQETPAVHSIEATPVFVEATPAVVEAAPAVVEATPVVVEATPVVVEATPVVVEATPVVVEATPKVVEAAPVAVETTPVKAVHTPVAVETTPVAVETTPVKAVHTPVAVETTSVKAEHTPVAVETTPVKAETTPVKVETSPAVVEAKPVAAEHTHAESH